MLIICLLHAWAERGSRDPEGALVAGIGSVVVPVVTTAHQGADGEAENAEQDGGDDARAELQQCTEAQSATLHCCSALCSPPMFFLLVSMVSLLHETTLYGYTRDGMAQPQQPNPILG